MCKARFTIYAVPVLLLAFKVSSYAKYSGGTGESNSPYEIAAVADWQELMETPGDWVKHFVMSADIDVNGVSLTPVGNYANNFTGIFDGNDHVVRNADMNMPGTDYVGLFGHLEWEGQIKNLGVEDISIWGDGYVGSLVGKSHGIIRNCYSTGSVSGTGDYVGGLVGIHSGIISNSYSTGSVSGTGSVGGLVGYYDDGAISNCYSTGSVSGKDSVGGLVGYYGEGAISNCYSTGSVNGDDDVGGLVGNNVYGTIVSSFWDVNTSGWTTSAGGIGKTTSEMHDINTFFDCGWDFVGESANGTCNYWQMSDSEGYPILSILSGYIPGEPSGNGTAEGPYVITDANELGAVWYRPSACYVMANDIDLAGISWSGAIVPFFSGVFNGNDHTLRNADVNTPGTNYVGLFGYLGTDGQIRNLGVEDVSISGSFDVGGLVGGNSGIISNCYSTGEVSGTNFVGGLLGNSEARTGSTVSRSFWDVDTSGWTTSAGGEGKTTSQMQDINTFLDSGWDLIGENKNGTCNYWQMPEGGGYPVLSTFCGYIPPKLSGSGTVEDPYLITDANELGTVCYRPSAHYVMAKDIDLVGITWSTPLVTAFNGVFDGNSYSICNAEVNMPLGYFVGLVAYLGRNGEITNLDVEDVSILGRRIVGGLVGYSDYGTIRNCSLTGLISGKGDVGGLVGRNDECSSVSNSHSGASVSAANDYAAGGLVGRNWGAITNCYSTGSVAGGYHYVGGLLGYNAGAAANCYSTGHVNGRGAVGGLIGYNRYGAVSNCYSTSGVAGITSSIGGLVGCNNDGTISNSYSTGSVSGDYEVGGFLGVNSGTMAYCYSTGLVVGNSRVGGLVGAHYSGDIASSFWDVNTSGWTTSDGGTPKTTEEMKNESTFVSDGWDFFAESANGTEDIWAICEGMNYPRLVWQIPSADFVCPDGVGLEDFGHFGGYWGSGEGGAANLDGEEGIGFGDLMVFCEEWLVGR